MKGLSHIVLNVSNILNSSLFYESVLSPLGFTIADQKKDEYVRITNGLNFVLVLCETMDKFSTYTYHRKAIGLNHLAISVDNKSEVDIMENHLVKLRIPILGDGKSYMDYRKGYYSLLFEDPDRIMIEIVWHNEYYFSKEIEV